MADVVPPGHVEVSVNAGQNYPISAYTRLKPKVEKQAKAIIREIRDKHTVTIDPENDIYILAAEALALSELPSQQNEVAVRIGVLPRFDVALRYTGSTWRGEVYGQVLQSDVLPIAAGFGVAWHHFDSGFAGVLSQFDLLDFSELDVDLTVLAGHSWKHGAVYFGPKAIFSKYLVSGTLTTAQKINVNVLGAQFDFEGSLDMDLGQSWLVGGVVGGRVGISPVWAYGEVGVYQSFYEPRLLGQTVRLGGLLVYPSVGVGLSF